MRLEDLAHAICAEILLPAPRRQVVIERYYSGDKISELLSLACDRTLIVSSILNPHIFKVMALLDVPAICLVSHSSPAPDMVRAAYENMTALIVSAADKEETSARLDRLLGPEARIAHENLA